MIWLLAAFTSVLTISGMLLCFQQLQYRYPVEVYLFYTWLFAAIVLGIISLPKGVSLTGIVIIQIGLAGLINWASNYAYNLSLRRQPNSGYVEALASIKTPITYILSLLLFGAIVNLPGILGLIGISVGVFLVTNDRCAAANRAAERGWVMWGIIAGMLFAALAAINKLILVQGVAAPAATALFLFVAGVLFGLSALMHRRSLHIQHDDGWIFLLAGVFATIGNYTLFLSYDTAPNLSYPVALSSSRMLLLYIVALLLGTDRLDQRCLIGVVLTFASVLLLT